MGPNITRLLEETPEKPPRSKLEAHADAIRALRQKRRTYREIAQFFLEHLAITVAPSTIHDFIRVRRRQAKRSAASNGERPNNETNSPPVTGLSTTQDVQRRIAAVKRRTLAEEPPPLFIYEEEEPLKLLRKPALGKND